MSSEHRQRIFKELSDAGVTRYGLAKKESKLLPDVIQHDEHIHGVVYGQISGGSSAMLVATDKRIIFIDHQPFFTTTDQLTYHVVSGVRKDTAGIFTAVTLHTRVTDYTLRYVNGKCARIFVDYVEHRRISGKANDPEINQDYQPANATEDKGARKFLEQHELGVLSTVDRTGNVQGAVVYYTLDDTGFIYILTKSGTGKAKNIYAHSQVALTIHQPDTLQTLQVQGTAEPETRQNVKDTVMESIVKPRTYSGKSSLPPVLKIKEGGFTVIRINPTVMSFHDYSKPTE